jgi:AmmeMemoRadiSam system protein B
MAARVRRMLFPQFYPGDVKAQIAEFLARPHARAVPDRELRAAAVPHAGWRYSGAVAARTLQALSGRSSPEAILLLGAVHRAHLDRAALYPEGEWETPLGPLVVDADLAAEVEAALPGLVERNPSAHDTEHSLEVEAPMIRMVFPGVPVVPLMVPPERNAAEIGAKLGKLVRGRRIVAIASTDLTHYGEEYLFAPRGTGDEAHAWMRTNDERILELAMRLHAERIPAEAMTNRNACGPGALAAAAAFARELGAPEGTVLERTDSHEVQGKSGPFRMAVGYAGIVF